MDGLSQHCCTKHKTPTKTAGKIHAPEHQTPPPPPSRTKTSVKLLAETMELSSIPPNCFNRTSPGDQQVSHPRFPIINLGHLTSTDPSLRSQAVAELGKACQDLGVFFVINHGTPERVLNEMFDLCKQFFYMSEEEKQEYGENRRFDPIRYGSRMKPSYQGPFWRDYLYVFVHPQLHSPRKPEEFRGVIAEYSKAMRRIVRVLLMGISESLGFEPDYFDKKLNMDSSLQRLVVNYYPPWPCPEPELAIGIPKHTDPGLLSTLMQNGVDGLQVRHGGRWVKGNPPRDAIVIITADDLKTVTKGKYKAAEHRAVVNGSAARISIVTLNGRSARPVPKFAGENEENAESQ